MAKTKTSFSPGKSGNPGGRPKAERGVREFAREHTEAAIKRLVEIMKYGESEAAQVLAIKELLDRGWGKSIAINQHMGVAGGPPIGVSIVRARVEQRVTRAAAQIAARQDHKEPE